MINYSFLPVAPTLYSQPQSQVIVQPSTATFTCSASGLPRPVFSWLRTVNGSPVPITPSSKYRTVTTPAGTQNQTSSLMILNTSPDDATTYVCKSTNVVGSVNASSTLSVQAVKRSEFINPLCAKCHPLSLCQETETEPS